MVPCHVPYKNVNHMIKENNNFSARRQYYSHHLFSYYLESFDQIQIRIEYILGNNDDAQEEASCFFKGHSFMLTKHFLSFS